MNITIDLTQIGSAYEHKDWKRVDTIYRHARERMMAGDTVILQRDVPDRAPIAVRTFEQLDELEEWIRHMEDEYCLAEPYA